MFFLVRLAYTFTVGINIMCSQSSCLSAEQQGSIPFLCSHLYCLCSSVFLYEHPQWPLDNPLLSEAGSFNTVYPLL